MHMYKHIYTCISHMCTRVCVCVCLRFRQHSSRLRAMSTRRPTRARERDALQFRSPIGMIIQTHTYTHTHTHTHLLVRRMLVCECVSVKDVAAVLHEGGVKLSHKLLCHLLDQQGIPHLAEGSTAVEAGGGRAMISASASASAAEDDEIPCGRAGRTGRRARLHGAAAGGSRQEKRSRYK